MQAAASTDGRTAGPQWSTGKLRKSRLSQHVANLCCDLRGSASLLKDNTWSNIFLSGPSMSIRGGTDEIQKNIIGERVLGLPPDPRVDKARPWSEVPRN
jgi:alkylation response protein AidB-like acyl-CoA dehydrogenase